MAELQSRNTVVQALTDAGYYKSGSKKDLEGQFIEEQTIDLGGKSYTLAKLSYWDAHVFAEELDGVLRNQNPFIQEIFAKYGVNCLDLVRMCNVNSKQGFKGGGASGNELDFLLMNARMFYDPDSSTNKRTSWVRTIAATGTKQYMEGATSGVELTMGEEEGQIWLGWYNPATTPCVDAIQITMNTEPFDVQDLDFEQVQIDKGDVLIEMKEPWLLPPEQSGELSAYYFRTGTDEMRPIGLWVKMSRNLRALGTP